MAHNPANPPLVGPPAPTTYLEFYNAMPDTFNGLYTEHLEDFAPSPQHSRLPYEIAS